ncbi:MAG: alpha/beta fold hydrolase [Gemmatimonadales bacterium]
MRAARWTAGIAALAVATALVMYLWFPAALLHGIDVVQRRYWGFHRREVATTFGRVPYLDGGSGGGPPVVLLHGFQDRKETWLAVAHRLTDRYRVIIPDLHGFGENHAATNGDYGAPAQAQRVHAFIAALGIPAVHIAGVSMGGEIAGAFAAAYPASAISLGLISTLGTRPDTATPLAQRIIAGDNVFHVTSMATLDTLIGLIGEPDLTLPGFVKRAMVAEYRERNPEWDSVFAQLIDPRTVYLLDSLAPRITAPALVLWGGRDPLFAVSGGRRLAERMPQARFEVLPDCGHLCPATRPAEVAKMYRAFLGGVGR